MDTNRDQDVISLRPILQLELAGLPIERFQNETLRPILKLQHPITLALLTQTKNFNQVNTFNNNRRQLETHLTPFVRKNAALKNQLIGCIIGMFSITEFDYYQAHVKEINKRIITMQIQRYVDTLVEIVEY